VGATQRPVLPGPSLPAGRAATRHVPAGLSHLFANLSDPTSLAVLERLALYGSELAPGAAPLIGPLLEHPAYVGRPLYEVVELLWLMAAAARVEFGPPSEVAACRAAFEAELPAVLALVDHPDGTEAERCAAVAVLGELGWHADEVIPAVLGRYAREPSAAVRLALVLAAGELVGHAPGTVHRRRALAWLRRRRVVSDPAIRLAAVALAWRTGVIGPADPPALLNALDQVETPPPTPVAISTGTHWGEWVAVEVGADRDAAVAVARRLFTARVGAGAEALHTAAGVVSRWRSAVEPLTDDVAGRLTDGDPAVRAGAAHLLAAFAPGVEYASRLAVLLADPAARVADLAAWGLARLGDPRCLPRLRNRALMGTSVFDVVQAHHPAGTYLFSPPGLFDLLAPLANWATELLPRIRSALADADTFHQRRVLAEVLARWGAVAAPATPELSRLLDTDAAGHACAALGAIGPAGAQAAPRLLRLVDRGAGSRLRAAAAWALWRVTGDPDPAARMLGAALYGELGSAVLPWLADLGPYAAEHAERVRSIGATDNPWARTEAARALFLLTGDPEPAIELLTQVLEPLTARRNAPVLQRAVGVVASLGEPGLAKVDGLLREVVDSDLRYAYYGDWRAIVDDEALRSAAAAALAVRTESSQPRP
jgi:HEAT repeat protein